MFSNRRQLTGSHWTFKEPLGSTRKTGFHFPPSVSAGIDLLIVPMTSGCSKTDRDDPSEEYMKQKRANNFFLVAIQKLKNLILQKKEKRPVADIMQNTSNSNLGGEVKKFEVLY